MTILKRYKINRQINKYYDEIFSLIRLRVYLIGHQIDRVDLSKISKRVEYLYNEIDRLKGLLL